MCSPEGTGKERIKVDLRFSKIRDNLVLGSGYLGVEGAFHIGHPRSPESTDIYIITHNNRKLQP